MGASLLPPISYTDTQTGPILLLRLLMREVKIKFMKPGLLFFIPW